MAIILSVWIGGLFVGFILWMFWSMSCNNRTALERREIISVMFQKDNWMSLSTCYSLVSYEAHYKQLFWFRDPVDLYAEPLKSMMKEMRETA